MSLLSALVTTRLRTTMLDPQPLPSEGNGGQPQRDVQLVVGQWEAGSVVVARRFGVTGRLKGVGFAGWAALIVSTASIFAGCTYLVRSLDFAGLPRDDGDRWEVATAFAATVAAAFIAAAVAWVASRSAESSSVMRTSAVDPTLIADANSAGDLAVKASLSERLSGAFRAAALTAGVMANVVITTATVARVAHTSWFIEVAVMSVAVSLLSLYLAHVGGMLLRTRRWSGLISIAGWLTTGTALSLMNVGARSSRLTFMVDTQVLPSWAAHVETMLLAVVYLITGLAVMVNPKASSAAIAKD